MSTTPTTEVARKHTLVEEALFILHYRQGMNPHPMQKNFHFNGEFKQAIERGKSHCENMGLRFISVRPFFSNLESEEKKQQEG